MPWWAISGQSCSTSQARRGTSSRPKLPSMVGRSCFRTRPDWARATIHSSRPAYGGPARLETCDLVVLVFDASRPRSAVDGRLQAEFKSALVVESKCDLPQSPQPAGAESCIRSSAVTGAGIAALLAAISRRLVPEPPAPGEAVPFAATQIEALREALASVERHDEPLAQEVLSRLTSGVRGARG